MTGTKTNEQFREELRLQHPYLEPLNTYLSSKVPVEIVCQRCGHIWNAKPYSLLQGHGCPRCLKSGTSFMEQFILISFQEAIGYEKVISRDRTLIGMEIDILIPELHIGIEPGNWLLHKELIERDQKKRELCKQKQVELITIYDKYPCGKEAPFENNCIVFTDDYNKADHSNIRELVQELFFRAGINCLFSENEWVQIEEMAYNNALSITHDDFIKRLNSIAPTIQVLEKYQNANRRIKVSCSLCGFVWNAVPVNLLRGDGCRKCGTKAAHEKCVKSQECFVKEVEKVNPSVEVIGKYCGRHNPIKARCRLCGYEWTPRASSLLRGSNHKGAVTMHKKLVANCDSMLEET